MALDNAPSAASTTDYLEKAGFKDPYQQLYGGLYADPNSSFGQDSFDGALNRLFDRKGYQLWQSNMDKLYERQATNSARAWDLFFDSTATQRRVQDIKAAGLNPWLALQSGGINANNGEHTASSGSSARAANANEKSNLAGIVALFAVLAKILAA